MEVTIMENINRFIEPIINKKKEHHLSSYLKLKSLLKMIKKTSPSFDMLMEIYEFLSLIESLYMYCNDESHNLFRGVGKSYPVIIYEEKGKFTIYFGLVEERKEITIEICRVLRSKKDREVITFRDGDDDVIQNKYDEEKFLFIISCLMNGLAELMEFYYKNKKF